MESVRFWAFGLGGLFGGFAGRDVAVIRLKFGRLVGATGFGFDDGGRLFGRLLGGGRGECEFGDERNDGIFC